MPDTLVCVAVRFGCCIEGHCSGPQVEDRGQRPAFALFTNSSLPKNCKNASDQ